MKCNQCGTENTDDSVFCMNCGGSLTAPVSEEIQAEVNEAEAFVETAIAEEPVAEGVEVAETVESASEVVESAADSESVVENEVPVTDDVAYTEYTEESAVKKFDLKTLAIAGAAAVVAIIILICIIASLSGGKYIESKSNYSLFNADGEVIICKDGKKISKTVEGTYSSAQTNLEGDIATFLVKGEDSKDEDSDYSFSSKYDLYCVKGKKIKELASDVTSYILSAEGNAIAYVDDEGTLYSLRVPSGKKEKVAEEVAGYVISPNGKDIAYVTKDYEESTATVYVFDGSDKNKIGSNFETDTDVVGLSNGGKYVYINAEKDGEEAFYVYSHNGEDKTKLSDKSVSSAFFNYKNSQLMYSSDGKTYITEKGKEGVKVSSVELTPILPSKIGFTYGSIGIKDFYDGVFSGDGNVYYLNKKGECGKLASDASNRIISEDGKSVYYIKDSDLYVVKAKMNAEPKKLVTDVSSFRVTPDGDKIYLLKDKDLYCYFGGKKVKQVKVDISDYDVSCEGICFFTSDDELFVCKNGKKAKKIDSDVVSFYCYDNSVVYETSDDGTKCIYISDGGAKFKEVAKYDTDK